MKKNVNFAVDSTSSECGPVVKRNKGFTLVEMLVSLVLSAIIFVSAYQVISNLIQYQVGYSAKSDRQLDRLLVKSLINQILSKGLHQTDLFYRIQKDSFFSGEADSLRIISRAFSDHFDVPGYRIYRIYVKEGELFVAYNRYDKDSTGMAPQVQTSGIRVQKLGFRYYLNGEWQEQWREEASIPEIIKVTVTLPNDETVEWVTSTGAA